MGSGGKCARLWQVVSYQALRGRCIGSCSGRRLCFSTRTCWQFCHAGDARTLPTAKWSIRAGREEQLMSDFQAYECPATLGCHLRHLSAIVDALTREATHAMKLKTLDLQ